MEDLCKGFNNLRTKRKGVHVSCVYTCDICGLKSECESQLYTLMVSHVFGNLFMS